jgi:hypothetical protein
MESLVFSPPDNGRTVQRMLYGVLLVLFRDRRKAQVAPTARGKQMTGKVALVEPLHDQDDAAGLLVIETAKHGVVEPFIGGEATSVGERVIRFEGIVNDDEVSSPTGHGAANRRGDPYSSVGRGELVHSCFRRRESRPKQTLIKLARHELTAVAGVLLGEILGVAGSNHL